jgi:hypothetical protein
VKTVDKSYFVVLGIADVEDGKPAFEFTKWWNAVELMRAAMVDTPDALRLGILAVVEPGSLGTYAPAKVDEINHQHLSRGLTLLEDEGLKTLDEKLDYRQQMRRERRSY